MISALNVLCGTTLGSDTELQLPNLDGYSMEEINRPEYTLFELKEASLEAGKELSGRKRMPVLYAFGQTGYGKPGYNMMSETWDFYYMVGAGLKWNIWDWNATGQEKQVIENQQMILNNQRESFTEGGLTPSWFRRRLKLSSTGNPWNLKNRCWISRGRFPKMQRPSFPTGPSRPLTISQN